MLHSVKLYCVEVVQRKALLWESCTVYSFIVGNVVKCKVLLWNDAECEILLCIVKHFIVYSITFSCGEVGSHFN